MDSRNFNLTFIFTTFLMIAIVMCINFVIDPGNIYLKKILIGKNETELVKIFQESELGIVFHGNERFLKIALAKNLTPDIECVIIGSSHVTQLSSMRGQHIRKYCKTMLNLSVSGASFEDILIFLAVLEKYNRFPKKLFIEIAPWSFKEGMDARFHPYEDYLSYLVNAYNLNLKSFNGFTSDNTSEYLNLINLEYTKRSFEEFFEKGFSIEEMQDLKFEPINVKSLPLNIENELILKDGSLVHSTQYEKENYTNDNYEKEPEYKLFEEAFDKEVVKEFGKVIAQLKKKTQIHLFLTPYHNNSLAEKFKRYQYYFTEVQNQAKRMALSEDIYFHGSYWANDVECRNDEFYDFMHPKQDCIDKIFK